MAKSNSKNIKAAATGKVGKVSKIAKAEKAKPKKAVQTKSVQAAPAKNTNSANNYIIGYGSLIEFASRTRTAPEALYVRPVRVIGYVRGWFAQASTAGYSPTYVGAVEVETLKARPQFPFLNGVVYAVTEEELKATDEREDAGYKRVEVQSNQIQLLDAEEQHPTSGKFWIYLNKFGSGDKLENHLPSDKYPIVQSYVDICVNGCLEIEANFPAAQGFAIEFLKTTLYWSDYWVNDRPMPRRPFMYRENAYTIDALLAKELPSQFSNIRIEPASWEAGPQIK